MKHFGEYLVEKKIISEDQLVMALVEQNTKLPTIAQVAFEKKLLSSEKILMIFKNQFEKKTGFIEAARALNLWNEQIHQETEKYIGALRIPLGQILVENASIPLESITHALDNFLGEIQQASFITEDQPEPIETKTIPTPITTSDYSNYTDILNMDRKEVLLSAIGLMKAGDISLSPFKTVKDILHLLKGAASFASVKHSESVITTMESIMDLVMGAEIGKINADFIVNTGAACEKNVLLLWEISDKLKQGISENEMLQSSEFKSSFEAASASIEMIKFDLDLMI